MNERDLELRHLLSRTGFGTPTPYELAALTDVNYGQAVKRLLDAVTTKAATPSPDWQADTPPGPRGALTDEEKKAFNRLRGMDGNQAKAWWYGEMIATDSALTEHMTLFWHSHFTSSMRKVKLPPLMFAQNTLYRRHALGNFATLLRAASKEPAMLVYLDNNENQPDHPNENFARELLELFTLGEGHGYTEVDIREAARSFTGWRFRPDQGFLFQPRLHDTGNKTFLGQTGNFDGDKILDIVLEQPRVAEHVTEKLWRDLVSDTPDPAEVTRIAAIFRNAKYEIRPLVEAMLATPAFRAPENRGTLVKSPTDLVVGTYRLIGYTPRETRTMVVLGRDLGQELLDPPNVKGWPGGLNWIDTATVPHRYEFLNAVVKGLDNLQQAGATAARRPNGAAPALNDPQGRPRPQAQQRQAQAQAQGIAPNPRQALRQQNAPAVDPAQAAQGGPRPNGGGNDQLNPAAVDINALRAVVTLDPTQLAQLVLPLPKTNPGGGPGGVLGDLLRDPAFQLK